MAIQSMLRSYTDTAVNLTTGLLGFISRFALQVSLVAALPPQQLPCSRVLTSQGNAQVGVSMVLSFMFVWDMPNIARGAASLRDSRLAPFYNELAPTLIVFGQLFGKALQAQVSMSPPLASGPASCSSASRPALLL